MGKGPDRWQEICGFFVLFYSQAAIESVQGQPFQKLCSEIAKLHDIGPASFATAIDFLQGAGQSKNITQVGLPTAVLSCLS